jgi:hypothetical protein
MYAKLVTKATTVSANVYFNTLLDVITGVITSSSSLDSGLFDTTSSTIINTVPTTWETYDSAANTSALILSGCMPRVIRSPWTDSNTNHKYVHVGQINSTNTNPIIEFLHAEGWNSSTNVANNIVATPNTATATATRWYRPINLTNPTSGFVTIISASDSHLFVWNSSSLTGAFNGYIFLSEFSRDDAFNSVTNGYPSWFMEGADSTTLDYPGSNISSSNHTGGITRIYDPGSNLDTNHRPISTSTYGNWAMSTRLHNGENTYQSSTLRFGGLATIGSNNYFGYNNSFYRDASKNPSIPLAEIRIIATGGGLTSGGLYSPIAYGSVSSKSPYIYATKSGWQSLDEIDIGGYRYTNLICNSYTAAQANASTILVKQV